MSRRANAIIGRWLWIAALGAVGAAIAIVAQALASRASSALLGLLSPERYQLWWIGLVAASLSLGLLAMMTHVISSGEVRFWWCYPPLSLAVAFGLALLAVSGWAPFRHVPLDWPAPEWFWGACVLVAAMAVGTGPRPVLRRGKRAQVPARDSEAIAAWAKREEPAAPTGPDLFNARPVAARIARLLSHPWGRANDQCIAILGPFGSGKSTVLGWAKEDTATATSPWVWWCNISCWGLESSSVVPAHVLQQAVAEVERHLDALPLRGLRHEYQRLLAAEPMGLGAKFADVAGHSSDPKDAFQQLSKMLRAANARLVLCIEDADRGGSDFDPQHIQRLLWTLRGVEGVSFILAVDPRQVGFDFSKVCDHLELLPRAEVDQVRALLRSQYDRWLSVSVIDPVPDRGQLDGLDLMSSLGELHTFARRRHPTSVVDAIAQILDTPRKLKHLVRRVDRMWTSLQGELDLDDLIALTALREGASASFELLVRNADAVRAERRELPPPSTPLQKEWAEHVGSQLHGAAIQRIVDSLGLKAVSPPNQGNRPQGIGCRRPTDYFRRFLAEQIPPNELRDQVVLRDIDAWISMRPGPMVERLLGATEEDARYVRVWKHFEGRVPQDRLLGLAEDVLLKVVERDGKLASGKHPAVLALWDSSRSRLGRTHAKWLSHAISAALPESLGFANELYYYWGSSRQGIVDEEGRAATRTAMAAASKRLYAEPKVLEQALDDARPWSLRHLVIPDDHEEPASVLTGPDGWAWLAAPLLVSATGPRGVALAPHVVRLVGDITGGIRGEREDPGFQSWEAYTLSRDRTLALFRDRTDALLRYLAGVESGEWCVRAAQSQAQQWLRERDPAAEDPAAPEP